MKNLRKSLLAALLVGAVLPCGAAPGWQKIFNGKDLSGWDGDPQLWSAKDGVLVGQTTAEHPLQHNTFLIWTNGNVADFELRCSFRITANNDKGFANSGIQYRSKVLDPKGWVVGGYQADMEAGPTYTGILYEERMKRGIMAARGEKVTWNSDCKKEVTGSLGDGKELQSGIKSGDWNQYTIIAEGAHLRHIINGQTMVDVTDDCEAQRATEGVLALQLHAGQPMKVEFKDLQLRQTGSAHAQSLDKELQGTWQIVSIETNGDKMDPDSVQHISVDIKGNTFKVNDADDAPSGHFKLFPDKTPKEIDITAESGPDAGKTMPGIYELNGESLRIIHQRSGNKRPSRFTTDDDSGLFMVTYKKKSD